MGQYFGLLQRNQSSNAFLCSQDKSVCSKMFGIVNFTAWMEDGTEKWWSSLVTFLQEQAAILMPGGTQCLVEGGNHIHITIQTSFHKFVALMFFRANNQMQ